jgi:hypothetical protein
MKHTTKIVSALALSFSLGLTGCGHGNSCDALAKKLCEGKDDATCTKTKAWLDSQMTGPKGEKLSSGEAAEACKMIADDKDALEAYKKQAADKAK